MTSRVYDWERTRQNKVKCEKLIGKAQYVFKICRNDSVF